MSERYVTLLGAEQVQSAASSMSSAAEQMSRAASSIHESMWQQRQFMEDWLRQFEAVVEKMRGPA